MDIQKIQQYNTRSLIQDLRQIIEQARGQVAATANYELTMMYWHISEVPGDCKGPFRKLDRGRVKMIQNNINLCHRLAYPCLTFAEKS